VGKLTSELEQVRGSVSPGRRGYCNGELDVSLIDISYPSSYEDYDNEG